MNRSILLTPLLAVVCGCGSSPVPEAPAPEKPAPIAKADLTPLSVTPASFTEAGDPVVEFDTPGIHCGVCVAAITQAVEAQDDVVAVEADAETKIVSVTFARDGFDPEASLAASAVVAAIADTGRGVATPIDPIAEGDEEGGEPGDVDES